MWLTNKLARGEGRGGRAKCQTTEVHFCFTKEKAMKFKPAHKSSLFRCIHFSSVVCNHFLLISDVKIYSRSGWFSLLISLLILTAFACEKFANIEKEFVAEH